MLFVHHSSVLALLSAAATTILLSSGANAQALCLNQTYPPCEADASGYIPALIPVEAWAKTVRSYADPNYPLDSSPVAPPENLTEWRSANPATQNKLNLPWISIENKGTELCGCTEGNFAFTFDDGPKDIIRDFVKILDDNGAKGSFFVIGGNVVAKPSFAAGLKAAYEGGHQIALHSYTHRANSKLTTDQLISEILVNARAVYDVIGKVPRYYRTPLADVDDRLRNLIVAMGMRLVLWNVDSHDTVTWKPDWDVRKMIQVYTNVTRLGYSPRGGNPYERIEDYNETTGFIWAPQAPKAVLTKRWPVDGFRTGYAGFISLQHELTQDQLTVARAVIPYIIKGTPIDPSLLPNPLPVTTAASANAGPTPTLLVNRVVQTYNPVTVAECDEDRPYFEDSHPIAQLVKSIKPIEASAVKPTQSTTVTSVKNGAVGVGGIAAIAATVVGFAAAVMGLAL
ncbi:chitin deacetylase [Phlyctochytrium bullatum]|nr:chitin deacetylase [Phlyctochytrium bullatum]